MTTPDALDKTELRVSAHTVLAGHLVIELWYRGVFVGQLTGDEGGPGVRVFSTSPLEAHRAHFASAQGETMTVITVQIGPARRAVPCP